MAASLKDRMSAWNQVTTSEDDQGFKEKAGNKTNEYQKEGGVGKLKHAYLEKDNKSAPAKRNFKISKRASQEEREKKAAEDAAKPKRISNMFTKADKAGTPPPSNATGASKRRSFGIFGKARRGSDASTGSTTSTGSGRSFSANPVSYLKSKARGSGSGAGIRLQNEGGESGVAPPPPKRLSILGRIGPKKQSNATNAFNLVLNKSRADEVEQLLNQITTLDGFGTMKRLSIRDNDIVQAMQKVIGNDPKQKSIKIDTDVRFSHLRASLIQDFGDSIRQNLYLKTLTIRGVELGNTFLEALSSAIMDNVTLEEIDLSRNHLTHDAMVEFCEALEYNHTVKTVYLQTQLSPLYDKGTEKVLASLEKNHSVKKLKIDFQDPQGEKRLKDILQRNYWNKDGYEKPDPDDLLVNFLKEEVIRAQEEFEIREHEKELEEVREGDWDYLYELAVLFDTFKIQKEIDDDSGMGSKRASAGSFASPMHEARASAVSPGKNPLTGAQGFPADGSFFTEEFISGYLQEDVERGGLVFNFCNQFRLFKTFPSTSPDRETIVNCFVYELLHHPRQAEFTGINMANTMCGDDFWMRISEQVLEDPGLLPNVHMINSETNFLTEPGIVAISKMIQSETSMKYIQTIRLENQKRLLSSKAERALARAICVNLSVVRFSLRVRNLLERDQIQKYVTRNIDFLRQARQHKKRKSGHSMERKRNKMEQFFDKIAANDSSITEVNIAGDITYKGLSEKEKVKSAEAFSTNTCVRKITMNALGLGDDFAIALGEALMLNDTIESICIEGNSITGPGFIGLFKGLGRNDSVRELRAKHQSKPTATPDEQQLPALVEDNTIIKKFSMDLRNSEITMKLDQLASKNTKAERDRAWRIKMAATEAEEARKAAEVDPDAIAEEDDDVIAEEDEDAIAEETDDDVIAEETEEEIAEEEEEEAKLKAEREAQWKAKLEKANAEKEEEANDENEAAEEEDAKLKAEREAQWKAKLEKANAEKEAEKQAEEEVPDENGAAEEEAKLKAEREAQWKAKLEKANAEKEEEKPEEPEAEPASEPAAEEPEQEESPTEEPPAEEEEAPQLTEKEKKMQAFLAKMKNKK